jgi:23S rRNA (uracil1939-C5)-methyltransferase
MEKDSKLQLKRGDFIDLTIESLAFGGEGVGKIKNGDSSFAVFVEDVVPGDIVKVRIGARKRNFARGYVVDFVKKAPSRIVPRCKHFGSCGGCTLQFLSYADQLKIKEQHVRDAMKRLGGFDESVVLSIIGCDKQWYYRNKMEFSFSRALPRDNAGVQAKDAPLSGGQASAPTEKGELSLGLHVRRRHHDLIELTECFLLNDYVGELVSGVREFFRKMDDEGRMEGEGRPLTLTVREGKHSGEIMINLTYENGEPDFLDEFMKALPFPKITSIYFTRVNNTKGSPKSINEKLLWGRPVIREELRLPQDGKSLKFEISPQAFFQPNTGQAEILYGEALKAAALTGREIVYDLFCGTGTIGSFCAHAAKHVYGIEINESAVVNARANAKLNGIENIEFVCGDVGKRIPELAAKPDVIILDPPRGGLDEKALLLTAELKAARIVYVSCNPGTLARDLKILTKTGYKLLRVQPVDMFPQTYHIECVAVLERV